MFIEKILEILQYHTEATVDLLDIFTSGQSESYKKLRRSMLQGPKPFKKDWAYEYRKSQDFYNLLNYLKREGFIQNKKEGRHSIWGITKRGLEKLRILKSGRNLHTASYKKIPSNNVFVIVFDIPEKLRRQRDQLRDALRRLGFSMVQKSVWIGKAQIPEEFIKDLKDKRLLSFIDIFEISRRGTLKLIS